MKKRLAVIMTMLTLVGSTNLTAFADETLSADVYVTISDQGTLEVSQEKITVTDRDNSGTLTIDEALYAAHEAKYEGGANAGYASAETQWGLGITMLWGDTSGNFGYYVNNASAWSLADMVEDGDSLTAFVYADGEYYSDTYCWFDITSINADAGKEISITLSGAGYDADWNPVTVPVEGATITVNGEKTPYKTDSEGKAVIKIENGGNYVISAVSDTQTLVPPVCLATIASDETAQVYVTISDKDGKLVLTQEAITVTDVDKDGYLTINDSLYAAHEAKYEGGAASGYASAYTEYGLSLNKLWGAANGGSYGYYVNNVSAWSLADPVKEGDYVNAFVYTDLTTWSDTYCWFDVNSVTTETGKAISLTLFAYTYDADWNKIKVPVEGAAITVNGEKTEYKTDKEGKVTLTIDKEGAYVISAVSDTQILVSPVCKVNVSAATVKPADDTKDVNDTENVDGTGTLDNSDKTSPETGDEANTVINTAILMMGLAIIVFSVSRKKAYEK